jgi:AcrR family transcriptional regulator
MGHLNGERRERKDAQRNLERVLQAAHELFAEHGAEVTMEDVARRAGVGVGTIYRRFPSKEHLFAEVSRAVCADLRTSLHHAAEADADPLVKLRALILLQYHRTAHQCAFIDLAPAPNAGVSCVASPEPQQLYAALHSMFTQTILEGQRQGSIRTGDPALLAALCLELLSPRAFQHLALLTNDSAEYVAECAIQFVFHGLGVCNGAEATGRPGDRE